MIKNKRGLIINVSSISGRRPTPLLSLYSGTKGFIDLFSRFVFQIIKLLSISKVLFFCKDRWPLNVPLEVFMFNPYVLVTLSANSQAFVKHH